MLEIAPKTTNKMSYDAAVIYCRFLDYNGHRDWRLPTPEEWSRTNIVWGVWYESKQGEFNWYVVPVRTVC
jgi:hypothetical protein